MDLLQRLKNNLRITWDDDDVYLQQLLQDGQEYFVGLTNRQFDWQTEHVVTGLLLDYCRYVYNHAADDFEVNYAKPLRRLIWMSAVGRIGKEVTHETLP